MNDSNDRGPGPDTPHHTDGPPVSGDGATFENDFVPSQKDYTGQSRAGQRKKNRQGRTEQLANAEFELWSRRLNQGASRHGGDPKNLFLVILAAALIIGLFTGSKWLVEQVVVDDPSSESVGERGTVDPELRQTTEPSPSPPRQHAVEPPVR